MESLFKLTDLEVRVPMNLNVLDKDGKPGVLNLREALNAWLAHRQEVLQRRSQYRLDKIERRLEMLEGYIIVFLNLDEVIRIIREDEQPKQALMARFDLTENQANGILDMRLRSLRRLEEMELRRERDALIEEQDSLFEMMDSDDLQWQKISKQIKEMKTIFAKSDKRLTTLSDAPEIDYDPTEILAEKEPITVICSANGWVRAMKGHVDLAQEFKFKEGDERAFAFHAETTDKILAFADNGRFYTLAGDKLPKGRGFGEPLNLMIDLPADATIISMQKPPQAVYLLPSSSGHGLLVEVEQALAQTKNGKQVLNVSGDVKAAACCPADGDSVAVVGVNRKLLVFSLDEVPVLGRGRGVILQRYKDGALADIKVFSKEEGLSWQMGGGRTRTETDLTPWIAKRGAAGKLPPTGFPRPAKFT